MDTIINFLKDIKLLLLRILGIIEDKKSAEKTKPKPEEPKTQVKETLFSDFRVDRYEDRGKLYNPVYFTWRGEAEHIFMYDNNWKSDIFSVVGKNEEHFFIDKGKSFKAVLIDKKGNTDEISVFIPKEEEKKEDAYTKKDVSSGEGLGKLVFHIDFNKRSEGNYTKAMHKEDFYTYKGENLYYKNHNGRPMFGAEGIERLSIVKDGNEKVLRVKYPKGKISPTFSGMQSVNAIPKKGLPKEDINNPRAYTLSYKVKFEKGFNFAIGGKLHGLAGGIAPGGSAIIGSERLSNGFTARFMWHKLGTVESALIGYIYHPGREGKNGQKIYGAGPFLSTANPAKSFYQRDKKNLFKFERDKWYEIRQEIRANTPYKSDGTYKVWINGELSADFGGMKWIGDGKHGLYGVDRFLFSTYYGGGTQEYAPKNDSYARFKEIKIYTR